MEKIIKLLVMWIEGNNQRQMPINQMTIREEAKSIFEILNR